MISKSFRIALMASLGLHVMFMSAVVLVNPVQRERIRAYTQVSFLGPLLRQTAFDIMAATAVPMMETNYGGAMPFTSASYLKVAAPERQEVAVEEVPRFYSNKAAEPYVQDFLSDPKTTPDFLPGTDGFSSLAGAKGEKIRRHVVYKPEEPVLPAGVYGQNKTFRVKVKALITNEGRISRSEPMIVSEHPELGMTAAKYVSSWLFEPRTSDYGIDAEWETIEVLLKTGNK